MVLVVVAVVASQDPSMQARHGSSASSTVATGTMPSHCDIAHLHPSVQKCSVELRGSRWLGRGTPLRLMHRHIVTTMPVKKRHHGLSVCFASCAVRAHTQVEQTLQELHSQNHVLGLCWLVEMSITVDSCTSAGNQSNFSPTPQFSGLSLRFNDSYGLHGSPDSDTCLALHWSTLNHFAPSFKMHAIYLFCQRAENSIFLCLHCTFVEDHACSPDSPTSVFALQLEFLYKIADAAVQLLCAFWLDVGLQS